jgi:hypothetical protein
LPISSTDGTVTLQSPAADEFEVELAGAMKLRITENDIQAEVGYEGLSDNSLITRSMLYGYGGGDIPITPPGADSGESWEQIDLSGDQFQNIGLPDFTVAADGVFSSGKIWSTNCKEWFFNPAFNGSSGLGDTPLAHSSGTYVTQRYFSYNMKNWAALARGINGAPFFWQGQFFGAGYGGGLSHGGINTGGGGVYVPGLRGFRNNDDERNPNFEKYTYRILRFSVSDWLIPAFSWSIKPLADNPYVPTPEDFLDFERETADGLKYVASKADGTMVIASQEANWNAEGDLRVCYIAENTTISESKPYKWEFLPVPGLSAISGDKLKGIARDESKDKWVVLTDSLAYVCTGNPVSGTWRQHFLPNAGNWGANFHFNGQKFIAVTSPAGSNLCISSEDGENWEKNTTVDVLGPNSVCCGTNGRSLLVHPEGFYDEGNLQLTGGLNITGTTTADVNLNEPVDTSSAYAERTGRATLLTQEDANGYFDEEIKLRAIVVTLTQAEYDAIPSGQLDSNTLYCITD